MANDHIADDGKKARLIDADAFIEDIKTENMNLYLDGMKGTPRPRSELYDIIDRINEQPTVDAVEVKHGRWEKHWCDNSMIGHEFEECSECGCSMLDTNQFWDSNYCPNCGAKMDGDGNA